MPGSARERSTGRWEIRVFIGRDPLTNKKLYATKTISAVTRTFARRAADDWARELEVSSPDATTITVGELLNRWWQFGVDQALWSPATELKHREAIDGRFKPLHDRKLGELRTIDLDTFYAALKARGGRNGKPLATSTVVRLAGMLRLALEQAVRWDLLTSNPAARAQPGRVKRKKVLAPADDHVRRLLAAAMAKDAELLCYLFLDAETGARRGEVAALRLTDFGADRVTITRALSVGVASEANARRFAGHYWPSEIDRGGRRTALIEKDPKTDESERVVALAPATIQLVVDQIARIRARSAAGARIYPENGFLFPDPRRNGDRPLRADTWTRRFARLRADTKITGVRLHDLRHYVGTKLLNKAGLSLPQVAAQLGHGGGGKTTIAIYGHPERELDRAASDFMSNLLGPALEVDGDGGGADIVQMPTRAADA